MTLINSSNASNCASIKVPFVKYVRDWEKEGTHWGSSNGRRLSAIENIEHALRINSVTDDERVMAETAIAAIRGKIRT